MKFIVIKIKIISPDSLRISRFLMINVKDQSGTKLVECKRAGCRRVVGILQEDMVNVSLISFRKCNLEHVSSVSEHSRGGSTTVMVNRLVELDHDANVAFAHPNAPTEARANANALNVSNDGFVPLNRAEGAVSENMDAEVPSDSDLPPDDFDAEFLDQIVNAVLSGEDDLDTEFLGMDESAEYYDNTQFSLNGF